MKAIKYFYFLLTYLLSSGILSAQYQYIGRIVFPPEIDGFVEEVWDAAACVPINKNFRTETTTVTGTWQALYDWDNFYILVVVEDDDHWPGWEANGDSWLYDKPEVYWDMNEVLKDGGGAGNSPGHWQLADGFTEGMYDKPITKAGGASINPGGTYAYSLVGEGYVYEMAIPWTNLKDNTGTVFDPLKLMRPIGFDVTIIDQDEDITTARQRAVWMNDGVIDECWNNMDGAGNVWFEWASCGNYLEFSSISKILSAKAASTDSITVNSNIYWTAVSDQSWLVVNPASYTGNGTLKFTASENTGASRSAIVWVNSIIRNQNIMITQEAAGVGISNMEKNKIRIFPNPATDRITIQGGIERVELFNSQGIKVKELRITKSIFSVGDLPVGVYLLKAYKNGDFAGVAKIFKN